MKIEVLKEEREKEFSKTCICLESHIIYNSCKLYFFIFVLELYIF